MSKSLVIKMDEETTEKYLELAAKGTAAEVEADCEPSGVEVCIQIHPIYGSSAFINNIELGDVTVEIHES